jgi:hypothetical protein
MARKKARSKAAPRPRVKDALNGNGTPDNVTKMPEPKSAEGERVPATEADYLAAMLHQARSQLVQFKQALLAKDKQLLEKDLQLLGKDEKIFQLETKMVDDQNAMLRNNHALKFDQTIHKDDETGEVYWLKSKEAPKQS